MVVLRNISAIVITHTTRSQRFTVIEWNELFLGNMWCQYDTNFCSEACLYPYHQRQSLKLFKFIPYWHGWTSSNMLLHLSTMLPGTLNVLLNFLNRNISHTSIVIIIQTNKNYTCWIWNSYSGDNEELLSCGI